jgi:hypothetical protein
MLRATKLKLAAYGVLLLTLFLPFSRCSRGTPTPAPAASSASPAGATLPDVSSGESPAPSNGESPTALSGTSGTAAAPASPSSTSPWYHLFERNSPEADYKYGMDLLIGSWEVPTALPKELDPMMLVPGRMFYVWPLAAFALALWWPPVRWRRSFHFLEFILALGGIWWAFMAVVLNEAMRGFYLAAAALALYALTALYEWIAEWRRLRRARQDATTFAP